MAGGGNNKIVTKFILLGFSDSPKFKIVLFAVFLGIYLLTVVWNVGLILLIRMDSCPCTSLPQHLILLLFLLCYLQNPSNVLKLLPEAWIHLLYRVHHTVLFSSLGLTECCLLAAMAYDCYAAICNPLLYTAIVFPTHPVCADDGWSLYNWYPWLIDTTVCFTSAQFLWPKYYQPLLLWPASTISPLLLWNIFPTSHEICDSSDFWCDICLNHHAII